LLCVRGLLVFLSRQLHGSPEDQAVRWAIIIGGTLSAISLLFLYTTPTWGVVKGLLPAIAGTLSVAALNERPREFFVLAAVAGLALWGHAVLTGGPRRRGRELALFAMAGMALAVGTILVLPLAAT